MTDKVRVSVIGLGSMGLRRAELVAESPDFELVATFDHHSAHPLLVASFSEAVARAQLVVLATPPSTHVELGTEILKAGRHLFVEKPMATHAKECEQLLALETPASRIWVGHSERFHPVITALRSALRKEEPVSFVCCRELESKTPEVHPLLQLGVHDLDLITHLSGATFTIDTAISSADPKNPSVQVELRSPLIWATVKAGYVRDVTLTRRQMVVQTKSHCELRADLAAVSLSLWEAAATKPIHSYPIDASVNGLAQELKGLAAALRGGASFNATGRDSARTIALVDQALALSGG